MRVAVKYKDDKTNEFANIKDVKMYYGVIELVCLSGGSILIEKENVKIFTLDAEKEL